MPCCSCGLEGPPLCVEAQRGCVVRELPAQHLFQRRRRRQTRSEGPLKAKDCWTPYSSAPFLSFTLGPSACLRESTGHPDPLPPPWSLSGSCGLWLPLLPTPTASWDPALSCCASWIALMAQASSLFFPTAIAWHLLLPLSYFTPGWHALTFLWHSIALLLSKLLFFFLSISIPIRTWLLYIVCRYKTIWKFVVSSFLISKGLQLY